MKYLKPKDLIAALSIILIGLLKYAGKDNALDAILALILGYYFAKRQDGDDSGK